MSGNTCSQCSAGQYSSGTTTCAACPKGQYSSSAGASSCQSCSGGTTTSGTGATACSVYDKSTATKMTITVNGVDKDVYATGEVASGITFENAASQCPEGTYLPSSDELKAIAKARLANPSAYPNLPDPSAYPNIIDGYYWSSTETKGNENACGDFVDFSRGTLGTGTKNNKLRVLCIGN